MPHPEDVQSHLELQFEKVDRMYANDDLRVFGRDTGRIFKEIDVIRRKQIELAAEHISLEAIDDMSLPVIQQSSGDNKEDDDDEQKRNLFYFNKKEMALKSLMDKLDTLGQIMNDFREGSDLNPHDNDTSANRSRTKSTNNTNGDITSSSNSNGKRRISTLPNGTTLSEEMSAATALKNDYYSNAAVANDDAAAGAGSSSSAK